MSPETDAHAGTPIDARRALTQSKITDTLRRIAATAPPTTAAQRAHLSKLLKGGAR